MTLRTRFVTNISTILTAIISLIIALSIPAGYFINGYLYMMATVNTEMAFSARTIEALIANNPKSWQFEDIRLQEILERRIVHDYAETRAIRDLRGSLITRITEPLSAPVVTFGQPVYDSGIEVARLEIACSLLPLVGRTAALGAGSVLLGIMIFLAFYFFTLRTVRETYEQLQENEQRLSLALKSGRFGILDWDLKKNVMLWDDRMYEIYGLPRDSVKLSAETWQNTVHEEDRESFLEDIRPEVIAAKGYDTAFRIVGPDGTIRYIKADGIVIRGEEGNAARLISLNQDITERKLAERALKESEANYRQLFENAPAGIYRVDFRNGKFIKANDVICGYLGCSHEELYSLNPYDLLSEESKELFLDRLEKMSRGEEISETVEYEIIDKRGRKWCVHLTNKNIYDEEGHVIASDVVAHDITERKRVENALRASEERFKSIVSTSQEWIWAMDAEGIRTFSNPAAENILGYRVDEIVGRSIDRSFIHPGDMPKMREILEQSVRQKKGWANFIYRIRHRDGTVHFLESSAIPLIDNAGTLKGFQGTDRDITDRRHAEEVLQESERMYRLLTEKMTDIVWIADLNLHTLYITPSVRSVLGFNPEERIPVTAAEQMTPESLAVAMETLAGELALEKSGRADPDRNVKLVLEYYHKDGTTRWLETTVSGLRNDQGVLTGLHGVSRDITAQKRAQEALQESEKMYRLLTEKMTDIVWIADISTLRTIYVSPSIQTVLGFTQEERMRQTIDQQLTPESLSYGLEAMTRELALEKEDLAPADRQATLILEYYHQSGATRWLETTISGIRDGQGVLTGLHGVSRDITEQKRVQDELRASEELYTRLVNTIPDMIARTTLDGDIVFVNDYALEISGYSRDEIEGRNLLSFIIPDDRDRLMRNVELLLEGKGQGPHEYQIILKDGTVVPFEVTGGVLRNEDGMPFGLVSECRDIRERKQAEENLQKSEEKYRQLAETARDVIVSVDLDFKITYANKATLAYSEGADLTGRSLLDFTPPQLHPIQREMMQKRREGFKETLGFEWEIILPRGKTATFDIRASLLTDDGKPAGVLFIGRDSTERKRSEEMLRQSEDKFHKIFTTTPDCIVITRMKDGLIMDVNLGFEEITGWRGSEAIGRTVYEINFWSNLADRDFMIQELKSGRDVMSREFQFPRKDGEVRTGVYSARSITIAAEACLIFNMRDITEKRRLEEERQKLEQQLFQSQKMEAIGQLAGGVAHDFNNMLSVIIGNTEMAMGRTASPELLHRALEDIMSAGKRSADLTRQLLAFARKQTISPEALDLNDMITGMLKMLRRLIGENISLTWSPAGKLWSIRMDPSQVDQLLVNLVVNARDAIDKGGKISIETSNKICDPAYGQDLPDFIPGEYVLLAVSDNGCGMEKEILANIFEPFFTTKNVGQGTGLGLATVYGIVKQNNGFINVYSELGRGTAFKIYLPRYHVEVTEDSEKEEEPEIRGGTETILIAEDEEAVLKLSRDMLEMLGYRVLSAVKAEDALQLARQYGDEIDLLLTDVVMPDIDGKELADKIAAIKPDLKCLFMSGYTADVISRQGILEEGVKFISKPFSLRGLAAKVREMLG